MVPDEEGGVRKRMKYYENFFTSDNMKDENCETASTPKESVGNARKKVVLVTDDAYYNRMVMKMMLQRLNILAIEAINGEEAAVNVENSFNKDSEYDIALILMDLNMPIMNGVDSTIKIRQLEKDYERKERIPIVAVTAHDSIRDKEGCLQAGMQEYLLKPVASRQLENTLKKYALNLFN